MGAIIVEGVLFVAMIAAGGALLYWVIVYLTPAGVRIRQTQNRKRIERAAELVCADPWPPHRRPTGTPRERRAGVP